MKLLRNKLIFGILIASQFMYGIPVYAEKYTSEPTAYTKGRAPVASNLVFDKPNPVLGDTVNLTYDFSDPDIDQETGTTVQWLRDNQHILGATDFSYTLEESNGDRPGQKLSAEVTPRTDPNLTDPAVGVTVTVTLSANVVADQKVKPAIENLVISLVDSQPFALGSSMQGTYSFIPGINGDRSDISTYFWGHKGQTDIYVANGSTILDSGEVPKYTLEQADFGKVMELSVLAKNGLFVVAENSVTVNTSSWANNGLVINAAAEPSITAVKVAGKLLLNEDLKVTYTFNDNGGDSADKSLYGWGPEDSTAAAELKREVVNKGELPDYKIVADDVGSVLELSILPKNALKKEGVRVTTTAQAAGAGSGDLNGAVIGVTLDPRQELSLIEDVKMLEYKPFVVNVPSNYTYESDFDFVTECQMLFANGTVSGTPKCGVFQKEVKFKIKDRLDKVVAEKSLKLDIFSARIDESAQSIAAGVEVSDNTPITVRGGIATKQVYKATGLPAGLVYENGIVSGTPTGFVTDNVVMVEFEVSQGEKIILSKRLYNVGRYLSDIIQYSVVNDAINYCAGLNARLPTQTELLAVFRKINAPYNACTYYGWPLENECKGSVDWYWIQGAGVGKGQLFNFRTGVVTSQTELRDKHNTRCIID